jgi:hypothetical protein
MGLQACEYLQTLLEYNVTDEQTQRLLMLVYARMGHRTNALNQFHQFQTILRTELNIAPLPETIALFHDIQNGRIPSDLALSQSVFEPASSFPPVARSNQKNALLQMQLPPEQIGGEAEKSAENQFEREKPSPAQEDVLSITENGLESPASLDRE